MPTYLKIDRRICLSATEFFIFKNWIKLWESFLKQQYYILKVIIELIASSKKSINIKLFDYVQKVKSV